MTMGQNESTRVALMFRGEKNETMKRSTFTRKEIADTIQEAEAGAPSEESLPTVRSQSGLARARNKQCSHQDDRELQPFQQ